MRTVVLGPMPGFLTSQVETRRAWGGDRYDEVWQGEYHMAPAPSGPHAVLDDQIAGVLRHRAKAVGLIGSGPFNLGGKDDYRVPDRGYHRHRPTATYVSTAAVVVEILSPDDETLQKFDFYAEHGVEEIIVVNGANRSVTIFVLVGSGYAQSADSALLGVAAEAVATEIDWE